MRACKKCGDGIPSFFVKNGKSISTSNRKLCLGCSKPKIGEIVFPSVARQKNMKLVTEYRKRMKLRAIEQKGGKCEECGYDKCIRNLNFHHRDPSSKSFGLNDGRTRRWEIIEKEIEKCVLLCANCHGEVHDGVRKLRPTQGSNLASFA
jgi:hypothetical protein